MHHWQERTSFTCCCCCLEEKPSLGRTDMKICEMKNIQNSNIFSIYIEAYYRLPYYLISYKDKVQYKRYQKYKKLYFINYHYQWIYRVRGLKAWLPQNKSTRNVIWVSVLMLSLVSTGKMGCLLNSSF